MSDHSLYNLNTTYPFLWKDGAFPESLKAVKDMRFVFALPSALQMPTSAVYTFKLKKLNNTTATIIFAIYGNIYEKSIPVFTSDANAGGGSFVILDQALTEPWGEEEASVDIPPNCVDIHPDCLVLLQEAPQLSVEVTSSYDTEHNRVSQIIEIPNDTTPIFGNGHNVTASMTAQGNALTLTLDCGSENGLGIWRTSPWSDKENEELPTFDVVGLRSINGVTGAVRILGDASVLVNTSTSGSVVNLTITGQTSGNTI